MLPDLFEYVQTVTPKMLPDRIELEAGVTVCDKSKWLQSVQSEAARRKTSGFGRLQRDLRWIYENTQGKES